MTTSPRPKLLRFREVNERRPVRVDARFLEQLDAQLGEERGYTPGTGTLARTPPRSVASSRQTELGHQAYDLASPDDCLARVRAALDRTGE